MADVVSDLLARVREALGPETASVLIEIEHQVRNDWGGYECYIAKRGEPYKEKMNARNLAILREWSAGERVPMLARKYQISRARVWNIIRDTVRDTP